MSGSMASRTPCPVCGHTEATAHADIAALRAEVERLRGALDGIANHPLASKPSDLGGWREFSKMLRRIARTALTKEHSHD